MSNELQQTHNAGANIYAQIRNGSAQIWNGSAFVTYATADIANYDVALTEQGTASGYYVANFPATITEGYYSILYKERAGGSPAESDITVGIEPILLWTGTAVYTILDVTVTDIAIGLLDLADGIETGITLRTAIKIMAAILAGKRGNSGTTSEQFDAIGNPGTTRVVGNLNSVGDGIPTLNY